MGQAFLNFDAVPAEALAVYPEQAAILAAQAGDWWPANAMELAFINDPKNGIEPYLDGELAEEYAEGSIGNAKAVEIRRYDDGLHVLWLQDESGCELCACEHVDSAGKPQHPPRDCPLCKGFGWRVKVADADDGLDWSEGFEFFETDIDGKVLSMDVGY